MTDTTLSTEVSSIKRIGFLASLTTLGYVFWVVGGMELIERLAFYGVKTIAGLYATDPLSKGGLGITMTEFGTILMSWALFQSFVPVFFGGLADRFGYKETIALSTVVKIAAYLTMAFFPSYWGFFAGACLLAFGTGLFKPGIQGTLVKSTTPDNSTMAWGVFYQMVNIGGWLGPLMAAQLRILDWQNVFFACAAIISINFVLLLIYKEPGKEQRLAAQAKATDQAPLWKTSLKELAQPHLIWYTVIFSGFWFMFMALFDVLPVHIRDWIDTSTIVTSLFGSNGTDSTIWRGVLAIDPSGQYVMPEGIMNINFGLIMLTCFIVAGFAARLGTMKSLVVGTLLCSGGLFIIGGVNAAWFILLAIVTFSIGEMLASPTSSKFIGNIAPDDKKAMYLGFKDLPLGIGWIAESYVGPMLYDKYAAKETLARELLNQQYSYGHQQLTTIAQGEYFDTLVKVSGKTPAILTEQLYQANNIGVVWFVMGLVGVLSAIGLVLYAKWIISAKSSLTKEQIKAIG
ncbi:MAG: MFS transporter [Gammaproteobacteria bacterium]|nr:MFS transporter [Gammaproteobacteria bacterium]